MSGCRIGAVRRKGRENVAVLPLTTDEPLPASSALWPALEAGLDEVIVIGVKKDGDLWYGGSISDVGEINLLLDLAKRQTLAAAEDSD